MSKRIWLFSLPMIVALAGNVSATVVGAETAAQLLAKAQSADAKCNYLQSSDHESLSLLVGKAEVALASQTDVGTAKSAMASGHAMGKSASCSPELKAEVEGVLSAARAASGATATTPELATQQVATAPTPSNHRDKAEPVSLMAKQQTTGELLTYASMTERYYKARRCNSMHGYSMASFYKDIVATHYRVVATYGVPAVAAVMHRSEAAASQQSCG